MKGDIATCPNCGKSFEQRRKDQQFCSSRCRYEYWNRAHPRVEIEKPFRLSRAEDGRLVIVQEGAIVQSAKIPKDLS